MSNIAIKANNISKAYQLGEFSTGTLSQDIQRRIALMRGKEDPYLRIGESNDRTSKGGSNIVWSLKDINFDIKQGDAVGIIGRNGAGKSTLLKVLSRVTAPTTGDIKIKGRIASLLEVGTGFHPELTGKENIFLNGAILGMRKFEIKKHFDAIVDFAGVERYIDTPVKRYSSGMYVRLAFAVAAHLESEILIVDEVLAVGDAEFQKKCLGKMGEVSKGEGRTVLFVSHNMDSVKSLCNASIVMHQGKIAFDGDVNSGLSYYKASSKDNTENSVFKEDGNGKDVFIRSLNFNTDSGNILYFGESVEIVVRLFSKIVIKNLELSFQIFNDSDTAVVYNWVTTSEEIKDVVGREGEFEIKITIPSLRLYKGEYYFGFYLSDPRGKVIYENLPRVFAFEVNMGKLINEWGWAEGACSYIETVNVEVND